MAIEWSEEQDVHVKQINDQHKHFIDLINKIHFAINEVRIDQELEGLLNDISEYAVFHFQTEESYFDAFQYEFSEEHKKAHREMLDRIADFQKRFKKEGSGIIGDFTEFLEDWLVDHIGTHDKKYVKCFNEHGLF